MDTNKLDSFEAICTLCILMITHIILNLPYAILQNTNVGSPLNLIYIGIIGFIFTIILNKLFEKFPNSDILDIAEYLGGKILKIIVGVILSIFLFLSLFIVLSDFINLLQSVYFQKSPTIFILSFFLIAILISNRIGYKSIAKTICFIFPFVIIGILFAFFAINEHLSFYKLTPILGDGFYSVFVGGLANLFAFTVIMGVMFLKPLIKNPYDFKKISLISFLISWLLLFITIITILFVFSQNENTSTINFLYMLSKEISISNFLQNVDALFILLWILSIFSYLSIITFIISYLLKKITNSIDASMFCYPIVCLLLGICLSPFNISHIKFIENTVYKYSVLILLFGLSPLILLLANWKFKRKNKVKN